MEDSNYVLMDLMKSRGKNLKLIMVTVHGSLLLITTNLVHTPSGEIPCITHSTRVATYLFKAIIFFITSTDYRVMGDPSL